MAHRYWRSRTLTPFDRRTKVAPGFTKLTQLLQTGITGVCMHKAESVFLIRGHT